MSKRNFLILGVLVFDLLGLRAMVVEPERSSVPPSTLVVPVDEAARSQTVATASLRLRSALHARPPGVASVTAPAVRLPVPGEGALLASRLREAVAGVRTAQSGNAGTRAASSASGDLAGLARSGIEVHLRANGTVRALLGPDLRPATSRSLQSWAGTPPVEKTLRFLEEHRGLLRLEDPRAEFAASVSDPDELGHRRVWLEQTYQGLRVWPATLDAHLDQAGRVYAIEGAYIPTPSALGLNPRLGAADALRLATVRLAPGTPFEVTTPELIIFGPLEGEPRLGWKFDLTLGVADAWRLVIAADDGRVLHRGQLVHEANVVGRGTDLTGASRTLHVWQQGATYYLVDASKPSFNPAGDPVTNPRGVITILDARNQPPENLDNNVFQITSTSATVWPIPAGVSAAFNFSETYDYFLERHNRNSLDAEGGNISAIVQAAFDNAFWNGGLRLMVFGNAKPYPASLDVVAHELAHGVTEHSANLIYQNQSGALNEALSDIFGEMVEARTRGQNDWLMGSELGRAFRSMKAPGSIEWTAGRPYPARMSQFVVLPNTDDGDNGGVHINSSIINHAFYLLAEGLPGAVGLRDAERIFYRALTTHLQAQSQFIDARLAAVLSAEELFGPGSPQALKVAEAFDAVEIVAAPSTPDPSPVPVIPGEDSNFHLYDAGGIFGSLYDLYRRETALGDGPDGRRFAQDLKLSRPAVTGDGAIIVFVTADHDLVVAATDDPASAEHLGMVGRVHSVAISPDGHWAALVLRDALTGDPLDQITVVDLIGNDDRTWSLVSPNVDGAAVDQILFADSMTFTTDSRQLVYDALSRVRFGTGGAVQRWSVFSVALDSGTTSIVVPPIEGVDTGNPTLGRAGSRYLALDAQLEADGRSFVFVVDLFSGDAEIVAATETSLAYPSFAGDEAALMFAAPDGNIFGSGFSVFRQPLSADRLQAVGAAGVYQSDARLAVIYRRGSFVGTNALPQVSLQLSTAELILPGSVTLTAQATDPDGTIQSVEFYDGAVRLGAGNAAGAGQYTMSWSNPVPGQHPVTARATDRVGGAADSVPVRLMVRPAGSGGGPRLRLGSRTTSTLTFVAEGEAGTYEFQRSADLRAWQPVQAVSIGAGGTAEIETALGGAVPSAAFFRLRKP